MSKRITVFLASIVCLACFAGVQVVQGATTATPAGCANFASIGLDTFCSSNDAVQNINIITGNTVVPGQTVWYRATLNRAPTQCCVTGGVCRIITPDGVQHFVGSVGSTLICNPGDGVAGSIAQIVFQVVPYTVRTIDQGVIRSIDGSPCDPSNTSVQAACVYTGGVNFCTGTCGANANTFNCNPVNIPRVDITKLVVCTTNNACSENVADYSSSASGAQFGTTNPKFCYAITITNTGTAQLKLTNVTDSVFGPVSGFPLDPFVFNPGDSATVFFGPTNHASTTPNTVTVFAMDNVSCIASGIADSSTATANVVPSTISCAVRFIQNAQELTGNPGNCSGCGANVGIAPSANPVSVVVRITNTAGNGQNILNGTIEVGGATTAVAGPIAPGAFTDVTITNIPGTAVGCYNFTANVQFQGALTGACPPIPTSCNNSLQICGEPCIDISKVVKCLETQECVSTICSTDLGDYAETATGVVDAGFCYSITITNCGSLVLTNVVVVDNQLGGPLAGFPSTLGIGESATATFQNDYSSPGTVQNTATVTAQSAGGQVTANDNASVTILAPSIECTKLVSLNGGQFVASGGSIVLDPANLSTNDLTFAVNVCNNGDVDLENLQIIDVGVSGCGATTTTVAFLPANAGAASCTNVILCTVSDIILTCPPVGTLTVTNIVNVCADVSTNVCSINPANCQPISDICSACTNTITITQPCLQPEACRTTGGGKQFDMCQSDNIPTPPPQYVTHGGQVGAPFAVATTCILNTPCIRGEWQHVRHISPKLDGNFHAASNGRRHAFDSLQCACLPCPDLATVVPAPVPNGATGTFCGDQVDLNYTNTLALAEGKRFALCNPQEPKNGCGPMPRKAPDNKICFSGIGDYALTRGRRARSVAVFRVDIEDRSEPGGEHPGGAVPPPDRYRFRMWLTGNGTDFRTEEQINTLRCQVACVDPLRESVCAPAPDVDDGGTLDRGNRQIHPTTSAKPPADCGDEEPLACD